MNSRNQSFAKRLVFQPNYREKLHSLYSFKLRNLSFSQWEQITVMIKVARNVVGCDKWSFEPDGLTSRQISYQAERYLLFRQ